MGRWWEFHYIFWLILALADIYCTIAYQKIAVLRNIDTKTPLVDPISNRMDALLNPSAAEVTFVQSQKKQKNMKITITLSCWYSLESPH